LRACHFGLYFRWLSSLSRHIVKRPCFSRKNDGFSQKQHHHAPPETLIRLAHPCGFTLNLKRDAKNQ